MNTDTKNRKVNISVSELVFFACRHRNRMSRFDGAIKDKSDFVSSLVKSREEKSGNSYYTDVSLSSSLNIHNFLFSFSSTSSVMIDNGNYSIDSVYSIRFPLKYVSSDFVYSWECEAKIKAFILAKKHNLEAIKTRVFVFHTETLEEKCFEKEFSLSELEEFFKATVFAFARFAKVLLPHYLLREEKNKVLNFPFEEFRDGQKEITSEVTNAIKNKTTAVINAPTGLGKTVATLFPAIVSQAMGECNKIFYLTAKNSGKASVLNAVHNFSLSGAELYTLTVTSKSQLCTLNSACKGCKFASSCHESTIEALFYLAENAKVFTKENIFQAAVKFGCCPFVLQTELLAFADVVVCDYNYIFSPDIFNKINTFFSGNDVFLVDEAHNLIDRLREIFSSEINLKSLNELSETVNKDSPLRNAIADFLDFVKSDIEDGDYSCEPFSSHSMDLYEVHLNELLSALQEENECSSLHLLGRVFDDVKSFLELLTKRSRNYIAFYNDDFNPEIFMVDTSVYIRKISRRLGSMVFFSATLIPDEYYTYMFGVKNKSSYVSFSSPYKPDNFLIVSSPISTKFSDREETVCDVASAMYSAFFERCGNYIAFFPSYSYMNLALTTFKKMFPDACVISQKPNMTPSEKDEFINSFISQNTKTMVAFAVLGSSFSEGIDLVGDKLSGAAVVGLGSLPPSRKSSLIASYFNDNFFEGEKFAYLYPGLNKVFQAGGRVIRSESDRGFLLIIDDRLFNEDTLELLPESWKNIKRAKSNASISTLICDFWQK